MQKVMYCPGTRHRGLEEGINVLGLRRQPRPSPQSPPRWWSSRALTSLPQTSKARTLLPGQNGTSLEANAEVRKEEEAFAGAVVWTKWGLLWPEAMHRPWNKIRGRAIARTTEPETRQCLTQRHYEQTLLSASSKWFEFLNVHLLQISSFQQNDCVNILAVRGFLLNDCSILPCLNLKAACLNNSSSNKVRSKFRRCGGIHT